MEHRGALDMILGALSVPHKSTPLQVPPTRAGQPAAVDAPALALPVDRSPSRGLEPERSSVGGCRWQCGLWGAELPHVPAVHVCPGSVSGPCTSLCSDHPARTQVQHSALLPLAGLQPRRSPAGSEDAAAGWQGHTSPAPCICSLWSSLVPCMQEVLNRCSSCIKRSPSLIKGVT